MKRYLFCISFNGMAYSGWQIQKNAITIQKVVQDALEFVTGDRGFIISCSRTDARVHANNFYFHMDTKLNIGLHNMRFALNNFLPDDIVVKYIKEVSFDFHARYSVKKKEYIYKIYRGKFKDPFLKGLVLYVEKELNIENMLQAAKFFIGEHDFTSFCCSGSSVINKIRTIYSFDIFVEKDIIIFKIVGDGFLYNMVRIMVGTLLDVSRGRFKADDIKYILDKKDRRFAGKTVKACGLYLNEVYY